MSVNDAHVWSDIGEPQQHLASGVGSDSLEMAERIAHKIDCSTLFCPCQCAFLGQNHGNRIEYKLFARPSSLFRRLTIEVFLVGFCVRAGLVENAVAVIGR